MSAGRHTVVNGITKGMKAALQAERLRQRKINRGRIKQRAAAWAERKAELDRVRTKAVA